MNAGRANVLKAIAAFLAVMLLMTLVSNKVNFWMTPEVTTTRPQKGQLGFQITETGSYGDGQVVFYTNLEKEPYLNVGDQPTVQFANASERLRLVIESKTFDEQSQQIGYICRLAQEPQSSLYDGQRGTVRFTYTFGTYDAVIPAECIVYEGGAYVYLVEEAGSVLGKSTIVRKTQVDVLARDDFQAAVSGSLNETSELVRFSSKALHHEQRVRVIE
ncbi:MAG: hypothetical protein Q4G52_00730 [Clostridia bacterium]|nr:hypothetical protein [Clostridia bacterium]